MLYQENDSEVGAQVLQARYQKDMIKAGGEVGAVGLSIQKVTQSVNHLLNHKHVHSCGC